MPAVQDERHVDVDDVAFPQRLVVRNAVADHVVDRGADGLGEAAIIERRRIGAVIHGEFEGQAVERFGGDAGLNRIDQEVERLGGQAAGPPHPCEGLGIMDLDLAALATGRGRRLDECHERSTSEQMRHSI